MKYTLNANINVTKFLNDKIGTAITNFSDSIRNNHTIYNVVPSDSVSKQLLDNIVEKQEYIHNSLVNYETEIELFAVKHNIILNSIESTSNKIDAQNVELGKIYKIDIGLTVGKDLTHIGATENIEGNAFICTQTYSNVNSAFQSEVAGAYVRQFRYFENSNIQYNFTEYNKLTGYNVSDNFSSIMYNQLIDNENSFIKREIVINEYLDKIRNDLSGINDKIYVNGIEILGEFSAYDSGLGYGTYSQVSDEGKVVSKIQDATGNMFSSDRVVVSGEKYIIRMITKGKFTFKVQSKPSGTFIVNNNYDDASYTYREVIFTATQNLIQVYFDTINNGDIAYVDYVSCMKYYENGLSITEMKYKSNYVNKVWIAKNNLVGKFDNYNTDYFWLDSSGVYGVNTFINSNYQNVIVTPSKYSNYIRNNIYYNNSFKITTIDIPNRTLGNQVNSGQPSGDLIYLYKSFDNFELPAITTDSKNNLKGLLKSELTLEKICESSGLN